MIYTWGYKRRSVEDLIRVLDRVGGILIDARYMPFTRYPGFHIDQLKRRLGKRYVWIRGFGNLNWDKDFSAEVLINDVEGGAERLKEVMAENPGLNPVILCACPDGDNCHRHEVVEWLKEHEGMEYQHLPPSAADKVRTQQEELF